MRFAVDEDVDVDDVAAEGELEFEPDVEVEPEGVLALDVSREADPPQPTILAAAKISRQVFKTRSPALIFGSEASPPSTCRSMREQTSTYFRVPRVCRFYEGFY